MIEHRQKMIEGDCYTVTQLPARRALRLKARLIKVFGPIFSKIIMEGKGANLADAIQTFSHSIDENTFETLITELLCTARKNGIELNQSTIDIEFAGDIAGIYKVAAFVIEVNYANFFTMLGITNLFGEQQTTQPVPMPRESVKDYTRT